MIHLSAVTNPRPAVVLPAVCQVAVPAELLEAVVLTLTVTGEINGPGHHLDVHQVVNYPVNISEISLSSICISP